MEKEGLRLVKVTTIYDSFEGLFHGWTEHCNTDIEGKEFVCKIAVVERRDNGKVVEVNPDSIQFLNQAF